MLDKAFKGMTDEMLEWQTRRFRELAGGPTDGYVVRLRPEQVVEIAFDGVQATRLAAARDLLDRADLAGVTKLEVEMPFTGTLAKGIRMRRPGATDEQPAAITSGVEDADVVDAEVVEEEPEWQRKLADKIDSGRTTRSTSGVDLPPCSGEWLHVIQPHEHQLGVETVIDKCEQLFEIRLHLVGHCD